MTVFSEQKIWINHSHFSLKTFLILYFSIGYNPYAKEIIINYELFINNVVIILDTKKVQKVRGQSLFVISDGFIYKV